MYHDAFAGMEELETPPDNPRCRHAWHLYILRLNLRRLKIDRAKFIRELQQRGIGTSVHFIPIPLLRYFCAAAAGAICLSARARSVSADCFATVVSGDDGGAGSICGPECPGDGGKFQTSEIRGGGHAGREFPAGASDASGS